MIRTITTRVPGKYAIMLTLGENAPVYMTFQDMDDLMKTLDLHLLQMIGEGYAGYEIRNRS